MAGLDRKIQSSFDDLLSGLDDTDEKIDIDEFEIVSEDDVTRSFFNDSKFTGSMMESPKVQIESEQKNEECCEQQEITMKPDLLNFEEPDEQQSSRGQTNADIVSDIPIDDKKNLSENSENDDSQSLPEEDEDMPSSPDLETEPVVNPLKDQDASEKENEVLITADSAESVENIFNDADKEIDAIFGSPPESSKFSRSSQGSNDEDSVDHTDGGIDLDFVKETDHLDVHSNKDKTSLVKRGSLARRKRPTRASMKRILNDDDSKFQDTTEPKKSPNNSEVKINDSFVLSPMNGELSPDTEKMKKRSPVMIAMPGMTGLSPDKLKLSRTRKQDFDTPHKDETDSEKMPVKLPYCSTPKTPEKNPSVDTFATPVLKSVSRKTPDDELDVEVINSSTSKSVAETNVVPKNAILDDDSERLQKNFSDDLFKNVANKPPPGPVSLKKTSDRKPMNTYATEDTKLETPRLKRVNRDEYVNNDMKEDDKPGKFDIPTLKVTGSRSHSPPPNKTPLKSSSTTPYSKQELNCDNFEDNVFQTPKLRSAKSSETFQDKEKVVKKEESQPIWLNEMKLKKTPSKSGEELTIKQNVETPSWMKTALDKKARMSEIMSKENASTDRKKIFPEADQENKTHKPAPLQESRSDSRENIRNLPNSGNSSPVIIDLFSGADKKSSFKEGRQSSRDKEKYVPSWSRTPVSKQSSFDRQPYLPPSSATLKSDDGIPPWKKELAERKKARRDNESSAKSTSETQADPGIPPWKREVSLKKRNSVTKEKEVVLTEPEWKKKADEKRSRLISSGVLEH